MILQIAIAGIAPPKVACVVIFLGTTRCCGVSVGAADETQLEGIGATCLFEGQTVLQYVAYHVAATKLID